MAPITVNVDNFARVESDTMIAKMLPIVGGLGVFHHDRQLAPLDQQPVIRQNRDTLYSVAIVDISGGATLTIPEYGDRYLSAMVINQDHYINRVFHSAGAHHLTVDEFDTDFVIVGVRILFDPTSETDIAEVHSLQDGLAITVGAQREFVLPDTDAASHEQVRHALLELSTTMGGYSQCFGRVDEVDPVRHLVGSASGWGGLPDAEASYLGVHPGLANGRYTMTFRDVPADAFWSLSVYNGDGYFTSNDLGVYNVNSVFGTRNGDGSITVHLGDFDDSVPNRIPLPDGWNLLIRLYRPRLDELVTWTAPTIQSA